MITKRILRRNENILKYHRKGWTYRAIGKMFHLSHTQVMNIIHEAKQKNEALTINRKGSWCPWKDNLFCQEEGGCLNCNIYYQTMPIPWDTPKEKEDVRDKG